MKRDLIYLILIVAAIAAVKVTARTTPETPAEIRPLRIEAGFTKTVHILFPSPVTYIDIGSMDIIAGKADGSPKEDRWGWALLPPEESASGSFPNRDRPPE